MLPPTCDQQKAGTTTEDMTGQKTWISSTHTRWTETGNDTLTSWSVCNNFSTESRARTKREYIMKMYSLFYRNIIYFIIYITFTTFVVAWIGQINIFLNAYWPLSLSISSSFFSLFFPYFFLFTLFPSIL